MQRVGGEKYRQQWVVFFPPLFLLPSRRQSVSLTWVFYQAGMAENIFFSFFVPTDAIPPYHASMHPNRGDIEFYSSSPSSPSVSFSSYITELLSYFRSLPSLGLPNNRHVHPARKFPGSIPPLPKKPTALLRRRKSRCPLLASASSSWGVMGVCDACGRRRRLFKPHSLSVGRRRSPHLLTAEGDERASLLSFPG